MKISKTTKNILKVLVAIIFYYGLYILSKDHFNQFQDLRTSNLEFHYIYLISTIILLPVNWFLESLKWKLSLRPVEDVTIGTAIIGVLRGVPPSLFTPNRIGEAIGRPSVLRKGHKFMGGLATAYCGFSQMPLMLMMGVISSIYFSTVETKLSNDTFLTKWWFITLGIVGTIILLLIFMYPKYTIPYVKNSEKSKGLRKRLRFFCKYTYRDKICLLGVSFARYLVYSIQNYLMIKALGIDIGFFDGIMSVFLIYTLMSFVPRPALTELGVRCSASVFVLKDYCPDYTLPIISSILLWIINLLIPALCGSMFYVIRKKEKKVS